MCGVIGLIAERHREDLGRIASELLCALEYRGYDSTGAAIQGDSEEVVLRKAVGAPSIVTREQGIADLEGSILCGQVRWATFGVVDDVNAQPHVVRCHAYLYGAHNGNVTNCDELKRWLQEQGHHVASDNDGEVVVHTVEHYFAQGLRGLPEARRRAGDERRRVMRQAVARAAQRLQGSYAAVLVDPVSRVVWAVKRGSSLYLGIGSDPEGGRFAIASSDLSSVLRMTRVLLHLRAGEVAELDAAGPRLFQLAGGEVTPVQRAPMRSRLRAKDTALAPPFETFMDQEIHAQEGTCRDVLRIFGGGSVHARLLAPTIDWLTPGERVDVQRRIERLLDQYEDAALRRAFDDLLACASFRAVIGRIPAELHPPRGLSDEEVADGFCSADAGFLSDLLPMAEGERERRAVALLDAWLEREEVTAYVQVVNELCQRCIDTIDGGGRIYLVCCGTSFHAAKAASLFFSQLARTEVLPLLPGEFRGQYADTLRSGDLFVAVSQSGETKDVIDVLDQAMATGLSITRVALVNNVNSTLAQEKSDLVIPLRCGPEIAVPATKSFINQLTVFYCLAVRLAERRLTTGQVIDGQASDAELGRRNLELPDLPALIRRTIEETDAAVQEAAQLLYLAPSMHLLATRLLAVAKEGALKVREVVLNHTEGFEGSEFKHGPNTILGFNTIFGLRQVEALLHELSVQVEDVVRGAAARGLPGPAVAGLARAAVEAVFHPELLERLDGASRALLEQSLSREQVTGALYADYPLVFITGPDPRDVALTVSQINTHKIRGVTTIVVAEDDPALRGAAQKAPANKPGYRAVYIQLPKTGDTLRTVFSATVALQRLALAMSLAKMAHLDALGIRDHGVHPDVPKNVSKSITVD